MKAALVLGNQLHSNHPALQDESVKAIIMIEAQNLCTKLPYHKHKLILLLSAMRHFAELATLGGKTVIYKRVEETPVFFESLGGILAQHCITDLAFMEPAEPATEQSLRLFLKKQNVHTSVYPSHYFMTARDELDGWLLANPKAIMEQFYRWQRRRLNILMDNGKPAGGKWNYDELNRKSLPRSHNPIPPLPPVTLDDSTMAVIETVDKLFAKYPGKGADFWLPVTYQSADAWMADFMARRLANFGPYEDAMHGDEPFLYHSVLSPLINCGLLDPAACIELALQAYRDGKAPLNSVEGFVRQIIGWREYMYGVYRTMPRFAQQNYFGFTKELEYWWYENGHPAHATLPMPVRAALSSAHKRGYNHHIERLMVLGNWFLLNQYSPQSVYRWFSAMYVDAYEWVMVPNVIGMSQYADGGRVATKPYISGGNYLKKMGSWKHIEQNDLDVFTSLYWDFLKTQKDKLKDNPRMRLMLKRIG